MYRRVGISVCIAVILLLNFAATSGGEDTRCDKQKFWDDGYIPRFADNVKSTNMRVTYNGKEVPCNSIVNLVEISQPPTIYYDAPSCCKNITVMEFMPFPVVLSPYLVWMTINVPPDNLRRGFTTPFFGNTDNNGYKTSDYVLVGDASGGVRNTTLAFFIYCQCGYIGDKTKIEKPFRGPFDIKGYAKEKRLGTPMAAFYHRFSATGVDTTKLTSGVVPKPPQLLSD